MAITDIGLNTIRSLIGSPQPTIPTDMAIGSGTTAFDAGDSQLEKENDRVNLTSYDISTNKVVTYIADFNSTSISGLDVSEFGLFNDPTADTGSIFNRQVITPLTFEGDRELQVQVTFRVSGA